MEGGGSIKASSLIQGTQDGGNSRWSTTTTEESYTIYILATRVVVTHEWLVYRVVIFRSNYVTMVTYP